MPGHDRLRPVHLRGADHAAAHDVHEGASSTHNAQHTNKETKHDHMHKHNINNETRKNNEQLKHRTDTIRKQKHKHNHN